MANCSPWRRAVLAFGVRVSVGWCVLNLLCIKVGVAWTKYSSDSVKPLKLYPVRDRCVPGVVYSRCTEISNNNDRQETSYSTGT